MSVEFARSESSVAWQAHPQAEVLLLLRFRSPRQPNEGKNEANCSLGVFGHVADVVTLGHVSARLALSCFNWCVSPTCELKKGKTEEKLEFLLAILQPIKRKCEADLELLQKLA